MRNLCTGFASRPGFLLTESLLIRTRAKFTKDLRVSVLRILSFKSLKEWEKSNTKEKNAEQLNGNV